MPGFSASRCPATACRSIAFLLILSLLLSCTTSYPLVPDAGSIQKSVERGDLVRVETRDGQRRVFVVRDVTESGLVGDDVSIPYLEIVSIDRQELAAGKTAGCLLAGIGALIFAGFLLFQITGPDIDFNSK